MTFNPNINFDVVYIGLARMLATGHNNTSSTEEKMRYDYFANDILPRDKPGDCSFSRGVYMGLTFPNKELHVYTNRQIKKFNEGGTKEKIEAEYDLNAVLEIESPRNPTHKDRFLRKRILPNSRSA